MKPAIGAFGQWLREWRRVNRYTIAGFARLADLSKAYVFELEHAGGNLNPSLQTLMAISLATGTPFTRVIILAAQQRLGKPEND